VSAKIAVSGGNLTVTANNSSLKQILQDTAKKLGIEIQGTPTDDRVFGVFGPASATVVLTQLLDGTNTNYMLVGSQPGKSAPRVLVITGGAGAPSAPVAAPAHPDVAAAPEDDDDDDDAPARPRPMLPMRPGGAAGEQPAQNVRTPQEILDDMQRRREEEQQNTPPQP
jgi:hypothetical protein